MPDIAFGQGFQKQLTEWGKKREEAAFQLRLRTTPVPPQWPDAKDMQTQPQVQPKFPERKKWYERLPTSFHPSSAPLIEAYQAGTKEYIQQTEDIAQVELESILHLAFYDELYSYIPALVSSGSVNSTDEALAFTSIPPDLDEAEFQQLRMDIGSLIAARDKQFTSPQIDENGEVQDNVFGLEYPPLEAPPEQTTAKPVTISQLSRQEILSALRAPQIPASALTEEEMNAHLKDKGWSDEDVDQQLAITTEQLIAEAKNHKSLLDEIRANGIKFPEQTRAELMKSIALQPALHTLEVLSMYFEHVSMPAAGWVYGMIPDIRRAKEEFKRTNPEASDREVLVYAWEQWDAPGPPVFDFTLKYLVMEGIVDPMTWIPLAGVALRWGAGSARAGSFASRTLGSAAGAFASASEVMDLPFDALKYLTGHVIPKTVVQRASKLTRESQAVLDRFFENHTKRGKVPLSFLKPKDMYEAAQSAVAHWVENPRAEDDIAKAAVEMLAHAPIDEREVNSLITRVRALGAHTIEPASVNIDTLFDIDTIFERFFQREITGVEATDMLLAKLGVTYLGETTGDATAMIGRYLSNKANNIIENAAEFAVQDSANAVMRAYGRKMLKVYTKLGESALATYASKSGRFMSLAYHVDSRLVRPWFKQLDRMLIRPAAESYLTFGLYGPMNTFEDMFRSFLGGVKPGRASLEQWDIGTMGLLGDPELRRAGMSEMIGPLRETGDPQRANWILTASLSPLSVPTYLATRGKVTPVRFSKAAYTTMVELFGGVGQDVRRNFVLGKYRQLLAAAGGDTYKALLQAGPKHLPAELDNAPKWVRRALANDVRNAKLTGQLNLDNTELISHLKSRFTRNRINRVEVDDILMRYPEVSPTSRSLVFQNYRELLRSPENIDSFMKGSVMQAELDDFLKGPEKARAQFRQLADILTELEVTSPDDLAEVIVNLHKMTQTYGALPNQIMGRATAKSRGLKIEQRIEHFDLEFDRIHTFLDDAAGDIDRVVEKVAATEIGQTAVYKSATQRYLDLTTTIRQEMGAARSRDIAYRQSHFAAATQKDLRNPHFWDDFYAHEENFWNGMNKKIATLNSRLVQAVDDINRAAGVALTPRPSIVVRNRPLAPADVARLIGGRGDDVSKLLMDNLLVEGDKDFFVEYVIGMAREGQDVGFTREAVESVYDQITNSLLVDPKSSSWFRTRQMQIESMTKDFHELYNAKLFPREQKTAVDNYIDETVKAADSVMYEKRKVTQLVPDYDVGLGQRVPTGKEKEISELVGVEKADMLVDDPAYLEKIRKELISAAEDVKLSEKIIIDIKLNEAPFFKDATGQDLTLKTLTDTWFQVSDNRALQGIGRLASESPEYLAKVRALLREKYPSGYIRIYRGTGQAGKRSLDREFVNVTSSRKTAVDFEDTWQGQFSDTELKNLDLYKEDFLSKLTGGYSKADIDVAEAAAMDKVISERAGRVDIDNILIKVDDVVSIGAVGESELIIKSSVLAGYMRKPMTAPVKVGPTVAKTGFTDYDTIRQQSLDESHKWYYKEYADYTNASIVDATMKSIYPFWTYESQRWFWLPRTFFRRPGTLTAWGRWEDNTDYGYVHIPSTSIDINPLRGTVFGTWSTRLMRKDYPEYYDQLEGFGGVVELMDLISRYGFYPNVVYGAALAQFGGSGQGTLGGILPSAASTPLNALIAAYPDNEIVSFISEKIFPENFRLYLAARRVDDLGGDGSLIFAKMRAGQELTLEEEQMWTEARRSVAVHSALFEQTGMMRMKSDDSYAIYKASEQFIADTWGISAEQQKYARQHNYKLWDMLGGLEPWESAALQELELFKYSGSINPVLPSLQQEILNKIELDWADVRVYSEQQKETILELQQDFLTGSERGRLTPDTFLSRVKSLYSERRTYIDEKMKANPLMLLENRTEYYMKYGTTMPVQSPYNELMSMYFSIELEETVDPGSGERVYDWDKFWANREMIEAAIPDEDKGKWSDYITRNTAPMMEVWHDVYGNYFRKYYDIWDATLQSYPEDEQAIIKEFLFLESSQQKLDRQAAIKEIASGKTGDKLISSFRSDVSQTREALRYKNPHLDAWLFYWGRVTSLKTPQAEKLFRQVSSQTGRVID